MEKILGLIKEIQSLAETGLHYSKNPFELQRNEQISKLCFDLLDNISLVEIEKIPLHLEERNGYKTPKVDIRAVVFDNLGKLLLVKEKIDQKWSLPGGWADIGYSPSEMAIKETREEAGIIVKPKRLLAILDKKCHPHPLDLYYIYKVFIECEILEMGVPDGMETTDSGFFDEDSLPELSEPRNTPEQIKLLFDFKKDLKKPPYFD